MGSVFLSNLARDYGNRFVTELSEDYNKKIHIEDELSFLLERKELYEKLIATRAEEWQGMRIFPNTSDVTRFRVETYGDDIT